MSLLNDALRKKHNEAKKIENVSFDQKNPSSQNVDRVKICRICGLLLLLGSVVFGGWYFLGPLSAQVDSPVAASSISKLIEIEESNSISKTNGHHNAEIEPGPNMPKPLGEITPLQEPAKTKTVNKDNQAVTNRSKKLAPPSTKKAEKKPRNVKKESLQKAPKAKDKSFPSHQEARFLQKALRYHRQGKFNQAIQMYQQVLRVKPDHQDALFNLASAYIQLTAYSEAYPLLKKLRSYNYGNPDILVNLAIVEIGMGKSAEAIHLLDLADKQYEEPKFEIYFHRAVALSRIGRLEEALLSYKTAEELNPKHPTLNFNIAVLCDKLHKYNEAVNYYRAFLRHSDNLPGYEGEKIESRIRSLRAYLAGRQS